MHFVARATRWNPMKRKQLTDIQVRNLKPTDTRQERPDTTKGLYIIVQPQPSGAKSFALRYRKKDDGKQMKLRLGTYFDGDVRDAPKPTIGGLLTLSGARELAIKKMNEIMQGIDPAADLRSAKQAAAKTAKDTFEAIARKYLKHEYGMLDDETFDFTKTKFRTGPNRLRTLKRSVFPTIGHRPITEIKKSDIVELLDDLAYGKLRDVKGRDIKGGRVAANRCLALIRRIINWHAIRSNEEDYRPPLLKSLTWGEERKRKRILNDDELRIVWKIAGEDEGPFGALIKFLLLTAARRNEAAAMPWSEIKGTDWHLPEERNKVKLDLIRPLSIAAQAVLKARPRIEGCPYVFTYGRVPLLGFSRAKGQFDKKVTKALGEPLENWTLHDLRRTARSLMSRKATGISPDHAERCLGHVIGGMRGVYDQYEFYDEKKQAFEALAALIERIVNPPPADNVVQFSKAGE
jgi:integrase